MSAPPTLVLAWGNPGRRDDGLGPAFAAAIAARRLPQVQVESGYQLQIEDAAQLAGCGRVFFVDAERCGSAPFRLRRIEPEAGGIGFTSHSVSPGRLLALGRDLFGACPEAWLMGIRGYDFDDFGEELTTAARANLEAAIAAAAGALARGDGGGGSRCAAMPAAERRGEP
ncbi:MAG: hydrogenase maturation protease [Thermoanaerobaculia bacterium]|nr:hydrogenase maturation protease [Thermoanaerobaculia bacterium]MBP9823328.1 hydrogenase maturation protease [Thermoanaerobaculia bacterium]